MSKPTFEEINKAFQSRDAIYKRAKDRRNEALKLLQETCEHLTIVGGNEQYGDVDWRVCVTCGLDEIRGYNDDGNEYDYATRAYFKKLPVKNGFKRDAPNARRAYKPDSERDLFKYRKMKA